MSVVLLVIRNVAIIALLALGVTVLPAGGNVVAAILTALSLVFFAAIAMLIGRLWKQTSLTRDVMDERQRAVFYSALGALALMIAGLDEMLDSGPGTVAWLVITGGAIYFAITTWRQASSY
jgi:Kef-type K+ transport system membrane component KefB